MSTTGTPTQHHWCAQEFFTVFWLARQNLTALNEIDVEWGLTIWNCCRDTYIAHTDTWRKHALCKLGGFLYILGAEMSIFTVTLIAADRMYAVVSRLVQVQVHDPRVPHWSSCKGRAKPDKFAKLQNDPRFVLLTDARCRRRFRGAWRAGWRCAGLEATSRSAGPCAVRIQTLEHPENLTFTISRSAVSHQSTRCFSSWWRVEMRDALYCSPCEKRAQETPTCNMDTKLEYLALIRSWTRAVPPCGLHVCRVGTVIKVPLVLLFTCPMTLRCPGSLLCLHCHWSCENNLVQILATTLATVSQ